MTKGQIKIVTSPSMKHIKSNKILMIPKNIE